jgi:LysM repeat protein
MSRRVMTTLMATAIMTASASTAAASPASHRIQPGETLTQIARQHGLTVDDLIQLNSIQNPDQIYAGDDILLSESEGSGDLDDVIVGDTVYEIRSGDSLTSIAQAFDVKLSELLAVNEIENVDLIFAGDFLIIPTGDRGEDVENGRDHEAGAVEDSAVDEQTVDDSHINTLHLIARGETLSGIALRYGVTVDQLARANDIAPDSIIHAGNLLRVPDPSWNPDESSSAGEAAAEQSSMLENMPVQRQSLSLSAEAASLSMVTNYWGHQVSEWVFIENMPYHPNPHRGFRGDMNGPFGGTTDYGVYARPLAAMLANYGFVGEEFYTMGNPEELRKRIDNGQPVLVWMTNLAKPQERFYEWHEGERFTLVPEQHVVVAYGYDEQNIYVADPGNGSYGTYSWDAFTRSWSSFDGMSMAVYPKG